MVESQHTPTFNMKVVVRETGLKPDTLRAWERRYGVPKPNRTAGGHRLYSQYQIDMLKWLLTRQEEGMSISHAIELWQHMLNNDEDPFGLDGIVMTAPSIEKQQIAGESIAAIRQEWLNSCLQFDEPQATQILAQAFAQFSVELVCLEIIQKGVSRVGQLWYEGEATVQQEHFSSSLAVRQIEALLVASARPSKDVRLILACPPFENHTFGVLLLNLLFRRQGWQVVNLGANVPINRLESVLKTVDPHLVVLSAQTLQSASKALPMAKYVVESGTAVAYGGAVFGYLENARNYMPGHFLGNSIEGVPEKVYQILTKKMQPDPLIELPQNYKAAVSHFNEKRTKIEASVQQKSESAELALGYLNHSNRELGDNILAALHLGDINLLTADINWLQGLLMNFNQSLSVQMFNRYIELYHEGAKLHLDDGGLLILNWFEQLRQYNAMTQKIRVNHENG